MFRRKPPPPPLTERWLLIGLGNPGRAYERSRHNVGFMCIDELARRHRIRITERIAKALVGRARMDDQELILAKPQTMMNLSGLAARALRDKFDIQPERLVAIHDELDLPFGRIRLKKGGSSAGNHGLDSLISSLGTRDFVRIRVGIGRPSGNGADYVLGSFNSQEQEALTGIIARAADAVSCLVRLGPERAMTDFNNG
ncbi:MAG TPA: aminoacyl-tRNA hydrolase [Candidatus Dormibacteraeota bacterium]|jgi:PTH1 family peptidyl-tRNA hydrolase